MYAQVCVKNYPFRLKKVKKDMKMPLSAYKNECFDPLEQILLFEEPIAD